MLKDISAKKEAERMKDQEIRETLEKQLQLLAERSQEKDCEDNQLVLLTSAMAILAKVLFEN